MAVDYEDLKPVEQRTYKHELAKFDREVVDLEAVLTDLVKVLQRAVQALRDELLTPALGGGKRFVTPDYGKRVKEVTAALSAATTCQNALRKTAKQRAQEMTPEERIEALRRTIDGLPYSARRKFVAAVMESHNAIVRRCQEEGIQDGPPAEGGPSKIFVELL